MNLYELSPELLTPTGEKRTKNPFEFGSGIPVDESPDLERILALPVREPLDPESDRARALVELMQERYAKVGPNEDEAREADAAGDYALGRSLRGCECAKIDPKIAAGKRRCLTLLKPLQAQALYEMRICNGAAIAISVGGGKSAVGAIAALAIRDCKIALLLVPPAVIRQFVRDYQLLREHFRLSSIVVHFGSGKPAWKCIEEECPTTLHVISYSQIQQKSHSTWIESLGPDLIIADEGDLLGSGNSTTSRRVLRFLLGSDSSTAEQRKKHFDSVRFVFMTGSISDSSISDYGKLLTLALRERSPVPNDSATTEDWGRCLDAVPDAAPIGALKKLLAPGEPIDLRSVRLAYQRRLRNTLGFIISLDSEVKHDGRVVGNEIRERKAPPLPAIVQEALKMVRSGQRPDVLDGALDNEEFDSPLAQIECAREVASGVFLKWIFPRGEPEALIREWYAARKDWNRSVREEVVLGRPFMDSPSLLEDAAKRAWGDKEPEPGRPEWRNEFWTRWRDVKDLVEPKTKAVRLHPFLVEDSAEWALSHHGIVWYGMIEYSKWLSELTGVTVHGGGPNAAQAIQDETGERSIICSIASHGRGRDGLQHLYSEQLIAQMMSSGKRFQQLAARLHRFGARDDVKTWCYLHVPELRKSLDTLLRKGYYYRETIGETPKLLSGWKDG